MKTSRLTGRGIREYFGISLLGEPIKNQGRSG